MQIWPYGAWFGLTRRRLQAFGVFIAGSLGLLVVLYGATRLLLFIETRRATALLSQLNNVKLGEKETAVHPILQRYEDLWDQHEIGAEGDNYTLRVDPWHFYRSFGPIWLDTPIRGGIVAFGRLRRGLGLRVWVVNGGLRLKADRVDSVWANVVVEGENEWLMANWDYVTAVRSQEMKFYKQRGLYRPEMERYLVSWTHLHMGLETGEGIQNLITPLGNEEEQRAARSINVQCLTSISGCHSLCDFMPDANRYRRQHDYPGWGWNSGSWAPQDHSCE